MLPVNNHWTPVLGIDLHLSASGNMFHPYIGMVIDPFDYLPFIGSSVHINGVKRGVSDTSGVLATLQHIPLIGPFVMAPLIGHESMNFFASETVFAEGTRLSPKSYMTMTCNDVGLPLSGSGKIAKKKFKFTPTLFAPTAFSLPLPIPAGKPVLLGGPYVPDWGGALMGLATSVGVSTFLSFAPALLKAMKKAGKKAGTSALKKSNKALRKLFGSNKLSDWLCKKGFEPVNLINGSVIYEGNDFGFPSMLPLSWERSWYSDSQYRGWLGHGVHCSYDRRVTYLPEEELLSLRLSDGRLATFPVLAPDDSFFHKAERITLTRIAEGYKIYEHNNHHIFLFTQLGTEQGYDSYYLTHILDADGHCIRFEYNYDALVQITDAVGRRLYVRSNAQGFISQIELRHPNDELETLVHYHYDGEGNMVGITDALNQTTHIEYLNHRMISKTDRNGNTFYWEYDQAGRCIHTRGEHGDQEGWIHYYPTDGYNVVKNALGQETIYRYDPNQLVRSIVDPLGNVSYFDYTEDMYPFREIDPEGRITGWYYDERGNQIGTSYPDGTNSYQIYDEQDRLVLTISPKGEKQVYIYDKEHTHRLKRIIDEEGQVSILSYTQEGYLRQIEKGGRKIDLEYDAQGNLSRYFLGGELLRSWEYDYRGRVVKEQEPLIAPLRFEYDALDRTRRIHRPDGNTIDLHYDNYDNVTEVQDCDRHIKLSYTPMGSVRTREERGQKVEFLYNKMEQLYLFKNEQGQHYRFFRDGAGRINKEIGFDRVIREFIFNKAGEVVRIDRPDNRTTRFEYNALGRVIRAEYSDGTWESFGYDKDGLLSSAKNASSEVLFERDRKGRIIRESQFVPYTASEEHFHVDSQYDMWDARIHLNSSLGAEQAFGYDDKGLLHTVEAQLSVDTELSVARSWESRIQYNVAGREIERFALGGLRVRSEYDSAGMLAARNSYVGKELCAYRRYSWAPNHRLRSLNCNLTGKSLIYAYDELGFLIRSSKDVGESLFRTPDLLGNLYRDPEPRYSKRQYGLSGRLLKDEQCYYRYDGEGNLIHKSPRNILQPPPDRVPKNWLDRLFMRRKLSKKEIEKHYSWQEGDTTYEWYGNGMLKSIRLPNGKVVSFEYDALGRRTLKEFRGIRYRYAWDGNVLLHEWNYHSWTKPIRKKDKYGRYSYSSPEPLTNVTTWVYDGQSHTPVAKFTEEDCYSIVQDHLGTPTQAFDSRGNKVWDCVLDIYGDIQMIEGDRDFIPFRFQGQYADVETGLYYNRFRYYSPELGNYISQDPIRMAGNNPTLYGYVFNPNVEADRLGLLFGKIIGSAQKTGTWGHSFISNVYAQLYSLNPRVERITLDLGYKKLVGGQFKYGPRPDVGILYKDGKLKVIEVASKTDKSHQLIKRNMDFMNANNIEGTVSVSQAAVFVNNVRDRVISGMKSILKGCK